MPKKKRRGGARTVVNTGHHNQQDDPPPQPKEESKPFENEDPLQSKPSRIEKNDFPSLSQGTDSGSISNESGTMSKAKETEAPEKPHREEMKQPHPVPP